MKYNLEMHHRRSIRLQGYDYSNQGAYFVTICTWHRENILGDVYNSVMQLNSFGEIVMKCWQDLQIHYKNIALDEVAIMPNHVHGIIWINGDIVGAGFKPAPTNIRHGLSEIIRALKTFSSRQMNKNRNTPGTPVWQRNYFDRIIRNEKELNAIREYIINNPLQWDMDENNPLNL